MKLVKLRLEDGRSLSSSSETLPPTCAEVRSTSGDSPVTVSDSSSAPICSARSICTVGPTCRTMFSVMSSRKPASRAVRVYGPGCRLASEYSPPGPVMVSRKVPVSSWVARTVAPGSTPPCSSETTPRIADVPCAKVGAAMAHDSPRASVDTTIARMGSPPRGARIYATDRPVAERISSRARRCHSRFFRFSWPSSLQVVSPARCPAPRGKRRRCVRPAMHPA